MAIDLTKATNEYELAFLQLCKENAIDIPMDAIIWPEEKDYYFPIEDSNTSSRCSLTLNTEAGWKLGESNTIGIRWKILTPVDIEKLQASVPKYVFAEYTDDKEEILRQIRAHVNKYFAHPLDNYSSAPTVNAGSVGFYFEKSAIMRHSNSTKRRWEVPFEMPAQPVDGKDLTGRIAESSTLAAGAFTAATLTNGLAPVVTE